jgi:hypothetical protein
LDGIISYKIVEGSFPTSLFKIFLEGLLNEMQPFLAANSVIVMDNCKIHRSPRIQEMIEEQYTFSFSAVIFITYLFIYKRYKSCLSSAILA